jgi:hypothetical protein
MSKTLVTHVTKAYPGGLTPLNNPGVYVTAKEREDGKWELREKEKVFGTFGLIFSTVKHHVVGSRREAIKALLDYDNPDKVGSDIFGGPHYPHPLDKRRKSYLARLGLQQDVSSLSLK